MRLRYKMARGSNGLIRVPYADVQDEPVAQHNARITLPDSCLNSVPFAMQVAKDNWIGVSEYDSESRESGSCWRSSGTIDSRLPPKENASYSSVYVT